MLIDKQISLKSFTSNKAPPMTEYKLRKTCSAEEGGQGATSKFWSPGL